LAQDKARRGRSTHKLSFRMSMIFKTQCSG
jgi:hypothetical protein